MRWYDDLYVGHNALKEKDEIIASVVEGKFQLDKYVLALPFNDVDVLDIYPSYILLQKRFMNSDMMIVGIAAGQEEAYDMAQLLIMDCYRETGKFQVKQYIENKMK